MLYLHTYHPPRPTTNKQLLEETTQALAELQTALPNLRWELALLLLCPAPSAARTAHGRLTAYLSVMERQLEIATGLFLSLRRIWVFGPHVQNATHREFARYLRRPLNALLAAWVAASDAVAGRVQRAALGVCGGRREGGRDEDLEALLAAATARHEAFMFALLRARLAVFFGFDVEEGWEEGMLGPGLVGSSVALEEDGGGAGDNSSSSSNPPKLVAEAEEEEQQGEQGQQQGARRPPSPTPTSNPPPAPPALPTPSSSSSYYYLPPPRPPTPTANATGPPSSFQRRRPTVLAEGSEPPRAVPLKRRESSGEDGVFRRFQRDYARLGAFALLPRNTFLLDVNLLVDSLPDLVAAVAAAAPGTAGDGDGGDDKAAPPFPWAAWAWDRLITPCLALLGGAAKARREKRRGSPPPPPGSQEEAAAEEGEGGGGGGGADVPAAPAAPPPPPVSLLKRLRLPFKVALSVVLASLSFFFGTGRGAHTPWAAFAVAASMSSHPGSSFRAGVSRVQVCVCVFCVWWGGGVDREPRCV